MDKDLSSEQSSSLENDFSLPKINLTQHELNLKLKKLSFLALNLDPYAPNLEDETIRNLVYEFKMENLISNPFQFTNQLLLLIDNTENELKSFAQ
jgi:hypothetical protein